MIEKRKNKLIYNVPPGLSLDDSLSFFYAMRKYGHLIPEGTQLTFVEYGALIRDHMDSNNIAPSEGYYNLFVLVQELMK